MGGELVEDEEERRAEEKQQQHSQECFRVRSEKHVYMRCEDTWIKPSLIIFDCSNSFFRASFSCTHNIQASQIAVCTWKCMWVCIGGFGVA